MITYDCNEWGNVERTLNTVPIQPTGLPCDASSRSAMLPTPSRGAEGAIGWKDHGKLQRIGGGKGVDRIRRRGMMVISCKNEEKGRRCT